MDPFWIIYILCIPASFFLVTKIFLLDGEPLTGNILVLIVFLSTVPMINLVVTVMAVPAIIHYKYHDVFSKELIYPDDSLKDIWNRIRGVKQNKNDETQA